MATLWVRSDEGWSAIELREDDENAGRAVLEVGGEAGSGGPRLVAYGEAGASLSGWALLDSRPPAQRLRVNGAALVTGVRVLRDRDAVGLGEGGLIFYSTDRQAVVEVLPERRAGARCGRCQTVIEAGAMAVACPVCRTLHHQTEALFCWTYLERCSRCDRLTAEGEFGWSPEVL